MRITRKVTILLKVQRHNNVIVIKFWMLGRQMTGIRLLCAWIYLAERFPIFLLKFEKALCAQTSIVQLTDVLYFVNGKLYHTALAFGIRICLALDSRSTAFAGNDLVFAMDGGRRHRV